MSLIYTYTFSAMLVWGCIVYVHSFAQKGRQTYRSNENSVNDDLNLSSVRCANFAFKLHNTRTYMYSLRNCYMHEQYPAVNYSPHSERFL